MSALVYPADASAAGANRLNVEDGERDRKMLKRGIVINLGMTINNE